jgi:hypothetical protein
MAAVGGAAAAVIVGVAALAGTFSGPSGHQGPAGQLPGATQPITDSSSTRATTPVLDEGGASTVPTPKPSATAASPSALCRQYMEFLTHPGSSANRQAENAVFQQLSMLAGGPLRIGVYCATQFGRVPSGSGPGHQGGLGNYGGVGSPLPGMPPGRSGFGLPAMRRLGRAGTGSAFGGR